MPKKGCSDETIRNWINPCLYTFIVGQILIGLMVIITSEYFKILLGKYVPEIEQNEINMKLVLFELFGFNVFLSYIGGLPLIHQSLKDPYTKHLSNLLKLWHFFIFTASLNGIFGGYMINGSKKFLKTAVETTLYHGIDVYYSDPEWRLIWDGFQYNEQCCGVINFKDWQSLAWMEYSEDSEKVQSPSEENLLSLTPYSCCKKVAGCYELQIPHKLSHPMIDIPNMNITSINLNGCLNIFSKRLDVLCIIIFAVVGIVFFLQIFILIVMRIVFMSNRSFDAIRTSNKESQTEVARGTPIIFNSSLNGTESLEILNECDNAVDNDITMHKKYSKVYTVKSNKNRVKFSDTRSDDNRYETSKLLSEHTN